MDTSFSSRTVSRLGAWAVAAVPYVCGLLFALGLVWGLFVAPPERMMGEVYRIMFVHVPAAWLTLVAYTVTFGASVAYLWSPTPRRDAVAEASGELGLVFNGLLLVTGAIWGRPTWGVWWSWDPRLTTAAILFFAFVAYTALRRSIDDITRRAAAAAIAAIVIFADVPIVWFSVRWWNSLHQLQSSPATVDGTMVVALRLNAFAFLALYLWLLRHRTRLALGTWQQLAVGPEEPAP
jgi:heme exporter protein C